MSLQFSLRVRDRRDVLPRVVMLVHRRGLEVSSVALCRAEEGVARISLEIAGDCDHWKRIQAHLRNLPDVYEVQPAIEAIKENEPNG